jgi:hypothetical protein
MEDNRPTKDTILWSVMRDHGFSNVVRAVFQKIYGDMDFDRFSQVNIHRVAVDLELWPKTVASALRQLERKGIICRGSTIGIAVRFRLNPNYGWIGAQSYTLSSARADRPAARLSA